MRRVVVNPDQALSATRRSSALPQWKRIIDIVGAAGLIALLSPVLIVLSVAIVIDSRGGILYRHPRVGWGGRTFTCWKFRSMIAGADRQWQQLREQSNEANGHIFKIRRDPRCTRVGRVLRRTSLDELPQLWNVVRGDMSLVGPRPPLPSEVEGYDDGHLRRLEGVPGMTGLWQVTGRARHDFDEMVELDVQYLDHLSLREDLRILAMTLPTVLFGRGSY